MHERESDKDRYIENRNLQMKMGAGLDYNGTASPPDSFQREGGWGCD